MGDPKIQLASRTGSWNAAYAWSPVKLFDGKWIWLRRYRWALYRYHLQSLAGPSVTDTFRVCTETPAEDQPND